MTLQSVLFPAHKNKDFQNNERDIFADTTTRQKNWVSQPLLWRRESVHIPMLETV